VNLQAGDVAKAFGIVEDCAKLFTVMNPPSNQAL
jgi:hypothetical protein